jgi:putative membrane protein
MQRKISVTLMALGGTLLLTSGAFAKMTSADVLNALHKTNLKEIHMGEMAENKGATNDMKDYGKMLASDHKDADQKVMDIATKAGIQLKSAEPGMMDNMEMKNMNSKTGVDFDKQFAKAMVTDHKKDIAKLQDAQKDDLSSDVKDLITEVLPKLQKHLETAQKLSGGQTS